MHEPCKRYVCECFFTNNYFLKNFNIHVQYFGENELRDDLKQVLKESGATEDNLKNVLEILQSERKRRNNLGQESLSRIKTIKERYNKLHPYVYKLTDNIFDPEFLKLVNYAKSSGSTKQGIIDQIELTSSEQVWKFPVFTEQFCDDFIEEICNFENSDSPKGRPNTMNNFGILLNEMGFNETFFDIFRAEYLSPIAALLLPDWHGKELDSHKVFTVKYKIGEDLDLSYHYDNAEITLNVSLGKNYEDGTLYFGKIRTEPVDLTKTTEVKHRKRYGLLHRGQHRHGAMPISGEISERHNLIIWMRSSQKRNQLCPMCDKKPILVDHLGNGDGFTKENDAENVNCIGT